MSGRRSSVRARQIDDARATRTISDRNTRTAHRYPPEADEPYSAAQDLLSWMDNHVKRYGAIYKASVYGSSVYVISAPEYAEHVLRKNWENYKKGLAIKRIAWLLGNGLMVSEGEFWKRQRRMIQPAFRHDAIGALSDVMIAANVALLESWKQAAREKRSVNVTRDISRMVAESVLMAIFGADYEQVRSHFRILTDESARNLQFAEEFRSLGAIVSRVAAERRKKNVKSTDMIGMLMEARDRDSGQVMPDRQLVNEILTLIVAGHETTASTLNWVWYLLSQHPKVEEKLWKELNDLPSEVTDLNDLRRFTYTRHILEEALRLYPPGWLMTRRALKDDYLGDYFVPAGTEIYISTYHIQRHPDRWEAADCFRPDRFGPAFSPERRPQTLLPFSIGPRNCIGEAFARLEMQIHLMTIARQLRLSYDEEKPPELEAEVNLRSKREFIMVPEIRVPANGCEM